jgi:hypothetical protein
MLSPILDLAHGKPMFSMFGWRIYDGLFVVADRSLGLGEKLFTM